MKIDAAHRDEGSLKSKFLEIKGIRDHRDQDSWISRLLEVKALEDQRYKTTYILKHPNFKALRGQAYQRSRLLELNTLEVGSKSLLHFKAPRLQSPKKLRFLEVTALGDQGSSRTSR